MNSISIKEKYNTLMSLLNSKHSIVYSILFILSVLFAVSMIGYWGMTVWSLNKKSPILSNTSSYSLSLLQNEENIKESAPLRKQLSDVLLYESKIEKDIASTKQQRQMLSVPFDNFLNMLYTPSINIWRNPFSQKIDTSLIGKKYIENNPYGDITLIQQWTNFFKDV